MSSRPWMPFYPNDFRLDTLDLATDEIGVYMIMICLAWHRGDGGLPNDMEWLKRSLKNSFRGFHGHTFNRIVPKLLKRYFTLEDDEIWYQKRVVLELQKADKLSAKQSQIAHKRWAKESKINNLDDASAMPSQSQPHTQKKETGTSSPRDQSQCGAVGKPTRTDEQWEKFKQAYPRRKGGNPWKPARTQWDGAIKRGEDPTHIIAAISACCGFDREKIGTEYIPQAVKWLRDERWKDHLPSTSETDLERKQRERMEFLQSLNCVNGPR